MFDDGTPIYRQIADDIREQVLAGTLSDGDQVMSTAQYATTFRINPATAAKAFALLVADGVLDKRRGIGMFVADGARARLLAEARETFFSDAVGPLAARARVLGIPLSDLADYLRALPAKDAAPGTRTLTGHGPPPDGPPPGDPPASDRPAPDQPAVDQPAPATISPIQGEPA